MVGAVCRAFFVFIGLLVAIGAIAQDAQYSQFLANPLYLNPALAGTHSGSYNAVLNNRSQWNGSIEKPFRSIAFGGDVKFKLPQSGSYSSEGDKVAVGVQIFSDRISLIDYNTTQISLIGAYHKLLSKETKQYLSAGFQMGLAQRGINYENLTFQDQFNGVNLFSNPTAEPLPSNSIVKPDIALGLHYTISPNESSSYYIGTAYHHANQPNISLYDQEDIRDEYNAVRLPAKWTAHLSASYKMDYYTAIEPRVLFTSQGAAQSTIVGANLKYDIPDTDDLGTYIGGYARMNKGLTAWTLSDVIIAAGFRKKGLNVGISYDANLLGIGQSRFGANTIEFSVSYTGLHDNDTRICPSF